MGKCRVRRVELRSRRGGRAKYTRLYIGDAVEEFRDAA
jgi:hypothetical protein